VTFFAGQRLTAALLNALANPGAWQTATLLNSWTGSGSSANGLFYRKNTSGDVDIVADIINATATGNSICATLAAGFTPSAGQNFPATWNNPAGSNSATPPWINVNTSGNVTVTGIESANKEIMFSFTVRLGAL
jgi:hypothetical protein